MPHVWQQIVLALSVILVVATGRPERVVATPAPADPGKSDEVRTEARTGARWTVRVRPIAGYRPSLTIGRPTLSDGIPRQIARRRVAAFRRALARCYRRALESSPGAALAVGASEMRLMLDPRGRVVHVAATGPVHDDVHGCMAAVLRRVRFPKPRACGMARLALPIELRL